MSGFESNLGKRLSESDSRGSSRDRSKKGKNKSWESSDSDNDLGDFAQALEKDLGGSSASKAGADPLDLLNWRATVAQVKDNRTYSAAYSSIIEINPADIPRPKKTRPVKELTVEDNAIIEKVKQIDIKKCKLITSQYYILYNSFEEGTPKYNMYYNMHYDVACISRYKDNLNDTKKITMVKRIKNLYANLISNEEDFCEHIKEADFKNTNLSKSSLEDAKNAREYFIEHFKP